MKNLLFLIFLACLVASCQAPKSTTTDLKQSFLEEIEAKFNQKNRSTIILKVDHCEKIDCEKYFSAISNNIVFYTREDAFMRAIKTFVTIQEIDEKVGKIDYTFHTEAGQQVLTFPEKLPTTPSRQ